MAATFDLSDSPMSPAALGEYLSILRAAGVTQASVLIGPSISFSVAFDPEPPGAGEPPTPGGWK